MNEKRINVKLAVDVGGTFTDVVLETQRGQATAKVLTTPGAPEEGVITGVLEALAAADVPASEVDLIMHGTTLATNAIIERKGAVTTLITTDGFRDVIEIGNESRYDQYDVLLEKVAPLVPRTRRLCVRERTDVHGRIALPLNEDDVTALIAEINRNGTESLAVGFLHSYANPDHENRVGEMLTQAFPNLPITLSSDVCPEVREYERLTTATANAYVRPTMEGYLSRMEARFKALGFSCPVLLMTSGGGLTTLANARRHPIRLVESGPAGGAILARDIARELDLRRVISFDMGGTTAKICLIKDFEPSRAREFEIDRQAHFRKGSGLPLRIPVIEMVEIGTGGGSIARLDTMKRVTIGPDSAGADPGPVAYGLGGVDPTVSDADIALGKVDPERFAGGAIQLDVAAAQDAISTVIEAPLGLPTGMGAFAVMEMVDETMANAARVHAVEQGANAAEYTLIAFGGAAPLHVGRLALKLNISKIVIPANAGVGSAVGLLRAPVSYEVVRSLPMPLSNFDAAKANEVFAAMAAEAEVVVRAGAGDAPLFERRTAFMRYRGQGHEIVVPLANDALNEASRDDLQARFDVQYTALFARILPNAEVEVLTWAVTIETAAPDPVLNQETTAQQEPTSVGVREVFNAETRSTDKIPLYWRADLHPGTALKGPAIIGEQQTSSFIPDEFETTISSGGHIIIEKRH